jgi:hypothetical protein
MVENRTKKIAVNWSVVEREDESASLPMKVIVAPIKRKINIESSESKSKTAKKTFLNILLKNEAQMK